MRKKIVAGNWKMNKTPQTSLDLVQEIVEGLKLNPVVEDAPLVVMAPPFTSLAAVNEVIKDKKGIYLAAQNCHTHKQGAYTGEISAEMLRDAGCKYIIIGHSERRAMFSEGDSFLSDKVNAVLAEGLQPIFCCGELLPQREKGVHEDVVRQQVENAMFHLDSSAFSKVVIAYEPVWAIGTGVTATPAQAQEMHCYIRQLISSKYGNQIAESSSILYGGSCNAANAQELFSQPDVDGGLIGGASLKASDFISIIHSF